MRRKTVQKITYSSIKGEQNKIIAQSERRKNLQTPLKYLEIALKHLGILRRVFKDL